MRSAFLFPVGASGHGQRFTESGFVGYRSPGQPGLKMNRTKCVGYIAGRLQQRRSASRFAFDSLTVPLAVKMSATGRGNVSCDRYRRQV
jgi:hypothetical protein